MIQKILTERARERYGSSPAPNLGQTRALNSLNTKVTIT